MPRKLGKAPIAATSSAAPMPAIIMGQDEKALVRLWQEKRGEIGPEDLSTNLIVQLGLVTEDLNRRWYERTRIISRDRLP
jgi:hypothetical protein